MLEIHASANHWDGGVSGIQIVVVRSPDLDEVEELNQFQRDILDVLEKHGAVFERDGVPE